MAMPKIPNVDSEIGEQDVCSADRYNVRDYPLITPLTLIPGQSESIGRHLGKGKLYAAWVWVNHPRARIVLEWDGTRYDYSIAELNNLGLITSSERLWWMSADDVINHKFVANFSPSLPITYYKLYRFYVYNPPMQAGQEPINVALNNAEAFRIVLADAKVKGKSESGVDRGVKAI